MEYSQHGIANVYSMFLVLFHSNSFAVVLGSWLMWYLPSFIHLANSAALSCVAFCMCMLFWALWRGVGGRWDEGGAGEVGWGGRGGLITTSLVTFRISYLKASF